MSNENVKILTAALRSGEFPQHFGALIGVVDWTAEQQPIYGFCCMGVAAMKAGCIPAVDPASKHTNVASHFADPGKDDLFGALPSRYVHRWLGLSSSGHIRLDLPDSYIETRAGWRFTGELAHLNDEMRLPFDQIADMIDYFGLADA